jgi:hypothetical protein
MVRGETRNRWAGLLDEERPGLHEDQDLEAFGGGVKAASAGLDPLESAPGVAVLVLEHGDADQRLVDP